MKWLSLALLRTGNNLPFMAALAVVLLLTAFAAAAGGSTEYPPAGVYDADGGEISEEISDALTERGFVLCRDAGTARLMVSRGELDCAVILQSGLGEAVKNGDPAGCMTVITSPDTCMEEAYRLEAAAQVYAAAAPYIAAKQAGDELDAAQLLTAYETLFDREGGFEIEVSAQGGLLTSADPRAEALTRLAAAVGLTALLLFGTVPVLRRQTDGAARALGLRRTVLCAILPLLAARWLLSCLAVSAGLVISGFGAGREFAAALIPSVWLCGAGFTAVSLLTAALLPGDYPAYSLITLLSLAGLALAPVYTDLSAVLPALGSLRNFVPLCWMWLPAGRLAIVAAVGLPLCAAVWFFAYRARNRMK